MDKKNNNTNRAKEDRQASMLKHPQAIYSIEIANIINDTLRRKRNIWVCCDWHLYRRNEKDKPECHKCAKFDEIISNYRKTVHPQDLVIYMGDLVDGELQDREAFDEIKDILVGLPGKKIMVRGNNDIKDSNFYKSCGFSYVAQAFVWANVLFTHIPIENAFDLNIHAHLHGYKTYWIPYTNQIDAAAYGARTKPVELLKLLRSQPIYAKGVKVDEKHFNEFYAIFDAEEEMGMRDPFPDEEE